VRARYFRENFAQAGIDLARFLPELVTNAHAAIAAARGHGPMTLRFGVPDQPFVWRRELRVLHSPAPQEWRFEVACADDSLRGLAGSPGERRAERRDVAAGAVVGREDDLVAAGEEVGGAG
jgi:hypothetical protein